MHAKNDPDWMTVAELCRHYGISERKVREDIRKKVLVVSYIGGTSIRISRAQRRAYENVIHSR